MNTTNVEQSFPKFTHSVGAHGLAIALKRSYLAVTASAHADARTVQPAGKELR
jgi:hypothetical protein